MNVEELRECCLALPHCTEDLPFGPDVLVFRVGGKIFAFLGLNEQPANISLKNTPDNIQALRDAYPQHVLPGWHLNKRHWNRVLPEGLPAQLVRQWVETSYQLVRASLTKKQQAAL